MASYRYRCEIPCKWLNDNGVEASINQGTAQIVVFAKPYKEDIDLAKQCKDKGATIVFDVTDPHFEHSTIGPIYKEMSEIADYLTCSSEYTADKLNATYIPDPYEFAEIPPHANGNKLVWFGHHVNYHEIEPFKNEDIRIVTGGDIEGTTFYSPTNLVRACTEANIALFPSKVEYKSPNRIVNALRLGLFPVSQQHKEFDMCWIGNPHTGIRWARHFKHDLNELVSEGQDYIRHRYSPQTIGQKWLDLFAYISDQEDTNGPQTGQTLTSKAM